LKFYLSNIFFIQKLTGVVSVPGSVLLVITLPLSLPEYCNKSAERIFQKPQKIVVKNEKDLYSSGQVGNT